jgi:hypothetical protein
MKKNVFPSATPCTIYFYSVFLRVKSIDKPKKRPAVITITNKITIKYQANSSAWQQTIAIHPNNNRGTETQQSATDFDANGNGLLSGAKQSCISPRGGRGFSADIKGIFG